MFENLPVALDLIKNEDFPKSSFTISGASAHHFSAIFALS